MSVKDKLENIGLKAKLAVQDAIDEFELYTQGLGSSVENVTGRSKDALSKKYKDARLATKDAEERAALAEKEAEKQIALAREEMGEEFEEMKTAWKHKMEKKKAKRYQSKPFRAAMAMAVVLAARRKQITKLLNKTYDVLSDDHQREELSEEVMTKVRTLVRMGKAYYSGEYVDVPWIVILKVVATVIYFSIITDLIPDYIPVIGFADDIAILAWVLKSVGDELERFEAWEAMQPEYSGDGDGTTTRGTAAGASAMAAGTGRATGGSSSTNREPNTSMGTGTTGNYGRNTEGQTPSGPSDLKSGTNKGTGSAGAGSTPAGGSAARPEGTPKTGPTDKDRNSGTSNT